MCLSSYSAHQDIVLDYKNQGISPFFCSDTLLEDKRWSIIIPPLSADLLLTQKRNLLYAGVTLEKKKWRYGVGIKRKILISELETRFLDWAVQDSDL